jgi:hypothetical protein
LKKQLCNILNCFFYEGLPVGVSGAKLTVAAAGHAQTDNHQGKKQYAEIPFHAVNFLD